MTSTTLKSIRERRGIGASDLAALAGVARQTIYAIEAGSFVPNTTVALQLARALSVPVEELFQLEIEPSSASQTIQAELLDDSVPTAEGLPVRLCRVGTRLIAAPVQIGPSWLPDANGTIGSRTSATSVFAKLLVPDKALEQSILIAGCDPAISVLSRFLMKTAGIDVASVGCSSRRALTLLKEGKVHMAGMHLRDGTTGEFNLPFIRKVFPHGGFHVVTYGSWEQGFVVKTGNPHGIRSAADLVLRGVKIMNREVGAGSRDLLDSLLKDAGIDRARVRGYDQLGSGHLSAAQAVLSGQADCCIATRNAAMSLGLDFVPLAHERYDFVTLRRYVGDDPASSLFDALNRSAFRSQLSGIAGYDTTQTGSSPA